MPLGADIDAARMRQLAQSPPRGANTVLVSHLHGSIKREAWMHLELAEIIVYRPDGKGGTKPVARVRVEEWGELRRIAAESFDDR